MRRLQVPPPQLLVALLAVLVATLATPALATTLATNDGDLGAVAGNETVSPLRLSTETMGPEQTLSVDADLSSALTADEERITTTLNARRFEHAFKAAAETQGKLDVVERAVTRLTSRADRLRSERRAAVRAFERGEIDAQELFRKLVRVNAGADGIERRIDQISDVVSNHSSISLPSQLSVRLTGVNAEVISLTGPVTEQIAAAASGRSPSQRVYLKTDKMGIALATIGGDTFVRETTDFSARAASGEDQFSAGNSTGAVVAYARAEELYPWASTNRVANPSIVGIGNKPIYRVTFNHRHGELTAYLDGRTTEAFHEIQRLQLSRLPRTTLATNSSGSLSVSVVGTFDGGPMLVSVTDSTGDSVKGTVSLDNETVGSTQDGKLWVLDTAGPTTVTVEADGESVSVPVDSSA